MLTINGKVVYGELFAYDGNHKIYICKNAEEVRDAQEMGYNVYHIDYLEDVWNKSDDLRFISTWDLTDYYVHQFEDAEFGETPMCGVDGMRECVEGIRNLSIFHS